MIKCTNCFVEKSINEFYNSNKSKNGKQSMCIPCYKAYFKAWRAARAALKPVGEVQPKVCLDCGLKKPPSMFGKKSSTLDKLNVYCKPCWNTRTKIAQKKHLAKVRNDQI